MVFENDYLETLAITFKRDRDFGTYYRICRFTKNLMDSIILGSRFNRTVPHHDLCSHLFLQMERWLDKWIPGNGSLYSYVSTCCKHGCISLVTKESTLRQRNLLMGDSPPEVTGAHYEMDFSGEGDMVDRMRASVSMRWHDPVIKEAVQYVLEEILSNGGIRQRKNMIRTMEYAFDLGVHSEPSLGKNEAVEVAKFLIDWTVAMVRAEWLERHASPVSSEDVLRLQSRYGYLPDVVGLIGVENATKLMVAFAGVGIRFPTASAFDRMKSVGKAYDEWLADPGPHTVSRWAKKLRMPEDKLFDLLTSWARNAQAGVQEDVSVY